MYLWIPTVYSTFPQERSFGRKSCTTYLRNHTAPKQRLYLFLPGDKVHAVN